MCEITATENSNGKMGNGILGYGKIRQRDLRKKGNTKLLSEITKTEIRPRKKNGNGKTGNRTVAVFNFYRSSSNISRSTTVTQQSFY